VGFFNDLGKIAGGIVGAIVPGFSAISSTGIFGSDLAAMSGGPQAAPVPTVLARSPNLLAATMIPPAPLPAPAPRQGVTCIPTPYLTALVTENRRVTTYVPPVAYRAQAQVNATTPYNVDQGYLKPYVAPGTYVPPAEYRQVAAPEPAPAAMKAVDVARIRDFAALAARRF